MKAALVALSLLTPVTSINTPPECARYATALGFSAPATLTRQEAEDAKLQLAKPSLVSTGARNCRAALTRALAGR